MNFFEHQERARRNSRVLVFLFILAVLCIVTAMNLVTLTVLGAGPATGESWGASEVLQRNLGLVFWTTLVTLGVILTASLQRSLALRGGGGVVARQLGGSLVEPDTTDPLRRRLRNVVEEMAIASGVPVPEIYVLEREPGINAFAAGYSPADAAVAVTQGALEQLGRDELQGVIAHEFSHILNGDMRLNIRLIGMLFGILVMAILGRRILMSMRYGGDRRNAGPFILLALAVMLIGYVGLFFGRWIKASVSRQREFLADASAVQFTRNPAGLAGALKRIGAAQAGSRLRTDAEEVAHMLFARGAGRQLFATHPPLASRIRAIDPSFRPEELEEIAEQMQRHAEARRAAAEAEAEAAASRQRPPRGVGGLPLDPERMIEQIGRPGLHQVLLAGALAAAIPRPLERAAHSIEWAPELLCYLLLDDDPKIRARQLAIVSEARGGESEQQVRALVEAVPELPDEQRLPLLEIAFPALRRRPEAELLQLMELVDRLIHADGRIDPFEYALARLTAVQIEDALHPERTRLAGRKRLSELRKEVVDLFAIIARHGHESEAAVRTAFDSGLRGLMAGDPALPLAFDDWPARLDRALEALDGLRTGEKRRLVEGLARLVVEDGEVVPAERELLRAVCASIHVPLPVPGEESGATVSAE